MWALVVLVGSSQVLELFFFFFFFCVLGFGWKLRVKGGNLQKSQVCTSTES